MTTPIPGLPPGFSLDSAGPAPTAGGTIPAPPAGFTIDAPPAARAAPQLPPPVAAIPAGAAAPRPVEAGAIQTSNDLAFRGSILPVGVTQDNQMVPAVPGDVLTAIDFGRRVIENGANVVHGVMSGQITPDNITGKQMNDLMGITGLLSPGWISKPALSIAPRVGFDIASAASRLGITLPRAVSSDSAIARVATNVAMTAPSGNEGLRAAAQLATRQLGQAADTAAKSVGEGTPRAAAAAVTQGITDFASGHGSVLAQRAGAKYDAVTALVDPAVTSPLSNTAQTVATITARHAAAATPEGSKATSLVANALSRPDGLTFQGIRDLRTHIGEMIDSNGLPQGTSQAEAKQIYGALTADMKTAVQAAGGDAASAALAKADQAYGQIASIRQNLIDVLGNGKSDEQLFGDLQRMAGSGRSADVKTLAQVRAATGDQWGEVTSTFIDKLGRDASGDFSPTQFAKQWGSISQDAKRVLFEKTDNAGLGQTLDDIATITQRAKSLANYAAPPSTMQTLGGMLATTVAGQGMANAAGHLLNDPVSAVVGVASALAGLGATVGGARVVTSIMSKPASATALAAYARTYEQYMEKQTPATIAAVRKQAAVLAPVIAGEAFIDDKAHADAVSQLTGDLSNPQSMSLPRSAPAAVPDTQLHA